MAEESDSNDKQKKFSGSLPIIYLWHWDSCPVAFDRIGKFVANIRTYFGIGHDETEFVCALTPRQEGIAQLYQLLRSNGVRPVRCKPKGRKKTSSEEYILQSLKKFVDKFSLPASVLIIHNDDFLEDVVVASLAARPRLHIMIVTSLSERSRRRGHETWAVKYKSGRLSSGKVLVRLVTKSDSSKTLVKEDVKSSEVENQIIISTPAGKERKKVKNRRKKKFQQTNIMTVLPSGESGAENQAPNKTNNTVASISSSSASRSGASTTACSSVTASSTTTTTATTGVSKLRKPPPPLNLSGATGGQGHYVHWFDNSNQPLTPKTPRNPVMTGLQLHGPSNDACYNLWPSVMYSSAATPILRTPITPHFNSTAYEPLTPSSKLSNTPTAKLNFRKTPGASRPGNQRYITSPMNKTSDFSMIPNNALFQNSHHRSTMSAFTGMNNMGIIEENRNGMLPAPPRGLNSRRSTPSPIAQGKRDVNGESVEVMVTNLDYNISGREWKKILCSEFQQQVQVMGVNVQTQADNTTIAYIQLASTEEARYAISQFHRKKIGYKRIHVSLVDAASAMSSNNIRLEVVALLQSVSANSLPLFKFIELYEKRYHRTISVSELYRLRDIVEIQESSGTGRMVSLINRNGSPALEQAQEVVESPVCEIHCHDSLTRAAAMDASGLPHVMLSLKTFAPQVHTLLQAHQGSMPIISFSVCYEAEFEAVLEVVREGGVPLEHLLSCVPGVLVAVTPRSGVKKVQWAENKPVPQLEWPSRASISSPLLSNQLSQFSREVVDLLRHQKACRMPFSNFIPTYHHHFGRQCRVADYGYTKLVELFEAIPHVVQILGEGNRRLITLSHRAQVKRFTGDLLRVLKYQSSKQIHAVDIPIIYNKIAGRVFDVSDYGVCYLEDMLAEVPENTIEIEGAGADMIICLPRKEQTAEEKEKTRQFALEVVDLLKNSPQCQIPFNKFIPGYHHHFGKQCRVSDYGFTKLQELFEAIPDVVMMREEEGEKVLCLTHPELVKVLKEHIVVLLKKFPDQRISAEEFLLAYMQHYGNSISFLDYGVATVPELIALVPDVAMIEHSDLNEDIVALVDNSEMERLAKRMLLLLMDKRDGQMSCTDLKDAYLSMYGCDLTDDEVDKLIAHKYIERWQPLTMSSTGPKEDAIRLSPLQQFARDMRTLLRVHQGRLPLPVVESAYAQHFGVPLVTHAYGFPSLVPMLQAINHVICIRGKGYRRTVLLANDFQEPVKEADRTDSGSPSSDSGITEDESVSLNIQSFTPEGSSSLNMSNGDHRSFLSQSQDPCYGQTQVPQSMSLVPPGQYYQPPYQQFQQEYRSMNQEYRSMNPTVSQEYRSMNPAVSQPYISMGNPSPMLQYAASLLPQTGLYPGRPPLTQQGRNDGMQNNTVASGALYPSEMYPGGMQQPPASQPNNYLYNWQGNGQDGSIQQNQGFPMPGNDPNVCGNSGENGFFPEFNNYQQNYPSYNYMTGQPFELEDLHIGTGDWEGNRNGFRKSRLAARFNTPLSPLSSPALNSSV